MKENEIEIKILGYSEEQLKKMVESIGAEFLKEENQINYRFENINLKNMNTKSYLRLRVVENEALFTLKERKDSTFTRQNTETTTKISDPEAFLMIMEKIGYKILKERKRRIKYQLDDYIFDIDIWEDSVYPKPYMEIEATSEEDMDKIIHLLGVDSKSISTKSIKELKDDYYQLKV